MVAPRWMVGAAGIALVVVGAFAQQPAESFAALREKADKLGRDVRRAEQEVAFTEETMLRLDGEMESRISALVDLIAKSKDSPGTDERIAACRAAAVAGLRRTLALYVAEREQRRQQGWDTSRLDRRIDLRLEQITKIAASYGPGEVAGQEKAMLEDQEMEDAVGAAKAGKFVGHVVQTRKELIKELEGAVAMLTARRDTLTLQMGIAADAAEKEKLAKEIAFAETMADKRRAQIAEILAAPELPEATQVGVGAATELERALREARRDLRASFMELQKLTTTRDYQQKKAEFLKAQLAQVKAAMEPANRK